VKGAHLSFLYGATITVNLLALVLSIWLGLFLVSRSPKYPVAWLTALMLWFMAGMFLNVLLAINPPPIAILKFSWLRLFFPFWPRETLAGTNNNWLQGWSFVPALALWHHVTVLLLPGKITTWRWIRIFLAYLLAVVAIIVQTNAQILFTAESSNPLYINSVRAGPWYPIFAIALLILIWLCVFNLVLAARSAPSTIARKQLLVLAWASVIVGLVGPVSIAGSFFMLPLPMLVLSLLEAIPIALIGWGVARYSALMEGRTIQKDFTYSLALLGLVLLIYIPISWILIETYNAPLVILAVFPALAVITHSSMTAIDRFRDRIVYTPEMHKLRFQLRKLSRQVGSTAPLERLLDPPLETLCNSVEATYGLVVVFENHSISKSISWKLGGEIPELELAKLAADDVVNLPPARFPPPLEKASLLVPLYGEVEQLGALVLGEPENGLHYAPDDIEPILEFADEIGETIQNTHRNAQHLAEIAELVNAQETSPQPTASPVSVEYLELALRNVYDYASLADNPLAGLKLVQSRLAEGDLTHLDRGKVLHDILLEGLEKLRPRTGSRSNPPSREWYAYLILQEAYLEETSNRDIMMKLYISEGTFNRTRRAAVRSLARTLGELEGLIS
jgi:hypothetical protein